MSSPEFNYQLLGRLQRDCEYFLNLGNGHTKHLWADTVEKHITTMKELWNNFPADAKPEWLSMEQILDYEQKMLMAQLKHTTQELPQ